MAPRAYWKGWLKLDALSCAVRLYAAVSEASRITFHEINRDTGHRITLRPHDSESGEELSKEEIVRGYEIEKGRYLLVGDEEVDELRVTPNKTIEIEEFVPIDEIDRAYLERPYFLAPDGKLAEEAYAVVREAMARANVAAIGRIVLNRTDHAVALTPRGRGMVMTTLRPPLEMREAPAQEEPQAAEPETKTGRGRRRRKAAVAPAEAPAPGDEEMVELAGMIMDKRAGHFDPARFEDRYQVALRRLVEAKLKGEAFAMPRPRQPKRAGNLRDMLRKAVAAEGAAAPPPRPRAKRVAAPRGRAAREPAAPRRNARG